MDDRRFRRLRDLRRLLIGGTVVVTLGGIAWIAADAESGGRVAAIAATLIAAGTLILDLIDFRSGNSPIKIDDVANELAAAVEDQWRTEASARGLRNTSVLPLRWAATERPVGDAIDAVMPGVPGRPKLAKLDGGIPDEFEDALTDLASEYQRIDSGRLVLLGEPGAGKTVLALLLTLGLVKSRPQGKVPVLLSVSDWDPVLDEPEGWVIATMAAAYYNGQTDVPRELLESNRLIPVLDGLDEIPEASRRVAVEKINVMVRRDRPVVVTCRTNEYADSIADGAPALSRAPVIEVQPVTADDFEGYMAGQHWPDGTSWTGVIARIRHEQKGPLASALSTPLTISLSRLVYQSLPERPAELLDEERFDSRHAIENSLAARTVRAAYSDAEARTVARAEHYLTVLARYLHEHRERDFAWWKLAGRRLSVWAGPTIGITLGLASMTAIAGVVSWLSPETVPAESILTFAAWTGGVLAVLVTVVWLAGVTSPGRMQPHLAGSAKRLSAGFRAGVAAVAIPVVPILFALALAISITGEWSLERIETYASAISAAVALAVLLGCAGAAQRWLDAGQGPATPIDPLVTLRLDLRLSIVSAALGAVIVGGLLAPVLAAGLWLGSLAEDVLTDSSGWPGTTDPALLWVARWWDVTERFAPSRGTFWAAMVVLPGLIVLILTLLTRPWPRYIIVIGVLAVRRQFPLRFARFLADAHRRGILRRSAGSYQFRHVRLQEQLVTGAAMGRAGAPSAPVRVRPAGRFTPARTALVGIAALLVTALLITSLPRDTAMATLRGDYAGQFDGAILFQGEFYGVSYEMTFSPKGSLIAVHSERDPTIRVYSRKGEPTAQLTFRAAELVRRRLLFSPDERLLFVQGYRSSGAAGVLWDLQSGDRIGDFELGGDPREGATYRFSDDSRTLAVATPEGAVGERPGELLLWNTADQSEVLRRQTAGTSLGNGDSMLTGLNSGRTELRRLADGARLRSFDSSLDPEGGLAFAGAGDRWVLSYSRRDGYRLWDANSGDLMISSGRISNFPVPVFDREARTAVFLHSDNVFRVWDLSGGVKKMIAQTPPIATSIRTFAVNFDHDVIAALDAAGGVHTWALDGTVIRNSVVPISDDAAINISPDGGQVVVMEYFSQNAYFRPSGRGTRQNFVAYRLADFGEGTVGLTTSWISDGDNYRIFRLADGSEVASFPGSAGQTMVNFGVDRVVVSEPDGTQSVRDMSSGREIVRLPVTLDYAVDMGETFAVTAASGSAIEVRSKPDGDCVDVLRGHAGEILSLALSPKKDVLASSSSDGTVRLWRLPVQADPEACAD